jgi:hypothetical protein
LTNKKSKKIGFAKALELKKIKNIVIAEKPTIEDVIEEVIEYYNKEEYQYLAKI